MRTSFKIHMYKNINLIIKITFVNKPILIFSTSYITIYTITTFRTRASTTTKYNLS